MNQILYVENKKNKGPIEISKIIKFFSICLIIFGIILLGQGGYNIYKNNFAAGNQKDTIPTVNIDKEENNIKISVEHDKAISKIIYNWNNETDITIDGNGRTKLEELIELPEGDNKLVVNIIDINDKKTTFEKEYVSENDLKIQYSIIGNNLKIIVTDEKGMEYVKYKWNDGTEQTIEVTEENLNKIEKEIEIPLGLNTFKLTAVNKTGASKVETKEIKGIKKPEINVMQDGSDLVIKVTDDEAIKYVDYNLNGQDYRIDFGEVKELEHRQAMTEGENLITIKAYNVNGAESKLTGKCVYQP